MATKCNSLTSLSGGSCPGKRIPMGFAAPSNAKGNYFLITKRSRPFGEHSLKPSEINCAVGGSRMDDDELDEVDEALMD